MKVKYETQHGREKIYKPNEDPMKIVRCPFGDMRPPFLNLRFYKIGGITPRMEGGQNLLAGKKVPAAPEFICGQTIILARRSIV